MSAGVLLRGSSRHRNLMDHKFSGTNAASFTGDSVYSNIAGTAPKYSDDVVYGSSLLFAANVQGIIAETFASTTTMISDRIYLMSNTCTTVGTIYQLRSAVPLQQAAAQITAANKLALLNAAGTAIGTSANALPVGTKFRVVYIMNGTAWSCIIYPNDTTNTPTETVTSSGLASSIGVTACREGFLTATGLGTLPTMKIYYPQDGILIIPGPRPVSS